MITAFSKESITDRQVNGVYQSRNDDYGWSLVGDGPGGW